MINYRQLFCELPARCLLSTRTTKTAYVGGSILESRWVSDAPWFAVESFRSSWGSSVSLNRPAMPTCVTASGPASLCVCYSLWDIIITFISLEFTSHKNRPFVRSGTRSSVPSVLWPRLHIRRFLAWSPSPKWRQNEINCLMPSFYYKS